MKTGLRQWLGIGIVAAMATAAGYFFGHSQAQYPSIAPEAINRLLAITLPDIHGSPQALTQWHGKIMVVNFWATWCPPCRQEMPGFERLSQKYAANGVQFVGIGIDQADKMRQFAEEANISYALLAAGPETLGLAVALGNPSQVLPFTVIIDRAGIVRQTKLGVMPEENLEKIITQLLELQR